MPIPPGFIWHLEKLVLEGSILEKIMAGLFLFMIWCSLRFTDAIRTDPRLWISEHDVIMGASRSKTKRVKKWIVANYALGDHSWLIPWYHIIMTTEPTERDFLLADIKKCAADTSKMSWTMDPLSYDNANAIFKEMIGKITKKLKADDKFLAIAEAKAY